MMLWWIGGSLSYILVAVLVTIGAWSPGPEDRPGGGWPACVAIGSLWPLFGVGMVIGVAFEGAWWLVYERPRKRQ